MLTVKFKPKVFFAEAVISSMSCC